MRRLALASLACGVLALGTGCDMFAAINDELNWGQGQLDKYAVTEQGQARRAQQGDDPAADAPAGGGGGKGAEAAAAARRAAKSAGEWWQSATSLAPAEKDPSIVRCDLAGGAQFMREADCLARGGRPSRG